MQFERRHDIDWLRVIAIWLLIIYHIAIGFQPWASAFLRFIQNNDTLENLMIPMSMLNIWRIPLLFYVSGMGVCFAMRKRNWKELLLERTKRILLPFVFGIVAIVPLHFFLWQNFYHQDLKYTPHQGHLWFLGNIFLYVLILLPLFVFLKKNKGSQIHTTFKKIMNLPLGIVVILLPFIFEALIISPEIFELYAFTLHGFLLGFLAFLVGYVMIYLGKNFWAQLVKLRWILLLIVLAMFLVRLLYFELKAPTILMSIESNLWIFTVLSFGHKYLNKPSKTLAYLTPAAYPVYIVHMLFLYLGSYFVFPMYLSATLKFCLLIIITLVGCYAAYELLIRRLRVFRLLFGLKITGFFNK